MDVELVGFIASALILVSLLMTSVVKLRIVNAIGAAVFVAYGLLIGSVPVWGMNAAIVVVDLWQLRVLLRKDERVEAVGVPWDSPVLARVLAVHAEDVARFAGPGFDGPTPEHSAWLVLRDTTPTSVLLARRLDDGRVRVDLDYATPATRDLRAGRLLHEDLDVLATVGPGPVVTDPGPRVHQRYLATIGFGPGPDGTWVRPA